VRGYVDVCARLLDEALQNSHLTILGCDINGRTSIWISLVDISAEFLDQASHSSYMALQGRKGQGREALKLVVDIGAEEINETPHDVYKA
jgi:hypothetical protein